MRRALGDFGIPIAIILVVAFDLLIKDSWSQKLEVPDGINPTDSTKRGWFINPLGIHVSSRERQKDTQTDKQGLTDREAERQTKREAEIDRQNEKQRETDRQKEKLRENLRETDRKISRERQT